MVAEDPVITIEEIEEMDSTAVVEVYLLLCLGLFGLLLIFYPYCIMVIIFNQGADAKYREKILLTNSKVCCVFEVLCKCVML